MLALPARSDFTSEPVSCDAGLELLPDVVVEARLPVLGDELAALALRRHDLLPLRVACWRMILSENPFPLFPIMP